MPSVTDWTSIVCAAFYRDVFLLGCRRCDGKVGHSVGFSVWYLLVGESDDANITGWTFFSTCFEWPSPLWQFVSLSSGEWLLCLFVFFLFFLFLGKSFSIVLLYLLLLPFVVNKVYHYSGHKGVMTRVRCSGIVNYQFITNLLLILLMKKLKIGLHLTKLSYDHGV